MAARFENVNIAELVKSCVMSISSLNVDVEFIVPEKKFSTFADKTTMRMLLNTIIQICHSLWKW